MGISLAWVAVEKLSAKVAISRLSLARTGKSCAYPFEGVASHDLPNDWFLVVARGCDHRISNSASMSALSKGCRAVTCAVEEHVGFASAECWENGIRIWHIQHQDDEENANISSEGKLPQRFYELLATVEPEDSENLDGHFHMDIPLILAKELTGFRYDDINPEIDSTLFEELRDLQVKRSWWKLWK
jgi:hypothetical protein